MRRFPNDRARTGGPLCKSSRLVVTRPRRPGVAGRYRLRNSSPITARDAKLFVPFKVDTAKKLCQLCGKLCLKVHALCSDSDLKPGKWLMLPFWELDDENNRLPTYLPEEDAPSLVARPTQHSAKSAPALRKARPHDMADRLGTLTGPKNQETT